MIIVNTTICIDIHIEQEWVQWMKITYLPLLMDSGLFKTVNLLKILNKNDENGISFALQMTCKDLKTFEKVENEYAQKFDSIHNTRFHSKFVSFRTLLEEV